MSRKEKLNQAETKKFNSMRDSLIGKKFSLYAKINDFTKKDDDKQEVTGIASSEAVDVYGDIVRFEAMEEARDDYMKFANIREMHGVSAAGTVSEYKLDSEKKEVWITAKIVDDNAWRKVKEDVYKGFSIGGRIVEAEPLMVEAEDEDGNVHEVWTGGLEITEIELVEISLVDRPANPEALIDSYKMASKENNFVPDFVFMVGNKVEKRGKEDQKVLSSLKKTRFIFNGFTPMNLFQKVWGNVVSLFKDSEDIDLEKFEKDDSMVELKKSELYSLVKQFVEKSVEAVESETKDSEEDQEDQGDDEDKDDDKEKDGDENKNKEKSDKEKEDDEDKDNGGEGGDSEDDEDDEEKDKEDDAEKSNMSDENFKKFEKAVTMLGSFEKTMKALSENQDAVIERMENQEENMKRLMKKAGVSTQVIEKSNTQKNVFEGIL